MIFFLYQKEPYSNPPIPASHAPIHPRKIKKTTHVQHVVTVMIRKQVTYVHSHNIINMIHQLQFSASSSTSFYEKHISLNDIILTRIQFFEPIVADSHSLPSLILIDLTTRNTIDAIPLSLSSSVQLVVFVQLLNSFSRHLTPILRFNNYHGK